MLEFECSLYDLQNVSEKVAATNHDFDVCHVNTS